MFTAVTVQELMWSEFRGYVRYARYRYYCDGNDVYESRRQGWINVGGREIVNLRDNNYGRDDDNIFEIFSPDNDTRRLCNMIYDKVRCRSALQPAYSSRNLYIYIYTSRAVIIYNKVSWGLLMRKFKYEKTKRKHKNDKKKIIKQ